MVIKIGVDDDVGTFTNTQNFITMRSGVFAPHPRVRIRAYKVTRLVIFWRRSFLHSTFKPLPRTDFYNQYVNDVVFVRCDFWGHQKQNFTF